MTFEQSLLTSVSISDEFIAISSVKSVSIWRYKTNESRYVKTAMVTPWTRATYLNKLIITKVQVFIEQ